MIIITNVYVELQISTTFTITLIHLFYLTDKWSNKVLDIS